MGNQGSELIDRGAPTTAGAAGLATGDDQVHWLGPGALAGSRSTPLSPRRASVILVPPPAGSSRQGASAQLATMQHCGTRLRKEGGNLARPGLASSAAAQRL